MASDTPALVVPSLRPVLGHGLRLGGGEAVRAADYMEIGLLALAGLLGLVALWWCCR